MHYEIIIIIYVTCTCMLIIAYKHNLYYNAIHTYELLYITYIYNQIFHQLQHIIIILLYNIAYRGPGLCKQIICIYYNNIMVFKCTIVYNNNNQFYYWKNNTM